MAWGKYLDLQSAQNNGRISQTREYRQCSVGSITLGILEVQVLLISGPGPSGTQKGSNQQPNYESELRDPRCSMCKVGGPIPRPVFIPNHIYIYVI